MNRANRRIEEKAKKTKKRIDDTHYYPPSTNKSNTNVMLNQKVDINKKDLEDVY